MSRILTIVDHGGNQLDVLDIRGTATCTTELVIPKVYDSVHLTRADVDNLRATLRPYGTTPELFGPNPHADALDMSGVDPRRLAALSEAVKLLGPGDNAMRAAAWLLVNAPEVPSDD